MPAVKQTPKRKAAAKKPVSGRVAKRSSRRTQKEELMEPPMTPGWTAAENAFDNETPKTPSPFKNRRMTRRSSMYVKVASTVSDPNFKRPKLSQLPRRSPTKKATTRGRRATTAIKEEEDSPPTKIPVKKITPKNSVATRKSRKTKSPIMSPDRTLTIKLTKLQKPAMPEPTETLNSLHKTEDIDEFKTPAAKIESSAVKSTKRVTSKAGGDSILTSTPIAATKKRLNSAPPVSEIRRGKRVKEPVTLDSTAFLHEGEEEEKSSEIESSLIEEQGGWMQWNCVIS
ncbi:hypothetical protein CAPTEDRAFT_187373 [Capitella teleta]|uniref:Uncharacterized protein n=1 Tax=Capitella teleta TaxID=283909 RepID=R7TSK7_CAPTE|nr:hypothetical protein CAPTEDRAFT_187373 [Capitella teleta]|eukprot:ELT96639.1 hypothetical protein CAPTEDRAFT_187373 [Capitella teleta]